MSREVSLYIDPLRCYHPNCIIPLTNLRHCLLRFVTSDPFNSSNNNKEIDVCVDHSFKRTSLNIVYP